MSYNLLWPLAFYGRLGAYLFILEREPEKSRHLLCCRLPGREVIEKREINRGAEHAEEIDARWSAAQ